MKSTTRFATGCALTLAAAGLLVMPAAQAQQQSPSPSVTTPSPTTTPTVIPDKKLDAAAAAVKKVTVIKNNYDQQLAQAPVDEKKRLQGEAGDAMAKAVTDQGLSIEEAPCLRFRVVNIFREARRRSPPRLRRSANSL